MCLFIVRALVVNYRALRRFTFNQDSRLLIHRTSSSEKIGSKSVYATVLGLTLYFQPKYGAP